MVEFQASDFVSLEAFSERWRFADAMYGYVSPDLAKRIRPLNEQQAAAVGVQALARHPAEAGRRAAGTQHDAAIEPTTTKGWLRELPVESTVRVLVSWNDRAAVLTDWEVFVLHWDDFCHASSDDVTVWAPDGQWTLCFWHYGLLQFRSSPHAV